MTDKIPKELFQLRVITDDPRFEGFALTESPSILGRKRLDDDICPGFADGENNPNWTQPRLKTKWVAPKVIGRVSSMNDYPGIDMIYPAFSQRAVDELSDLLEPNGELLPLRCNVGQDYFFYNITTISHALDQTASDCKFWCDPPTTTAGIDFFAFHEEKLRGQTIFRLREWPMGAIVSDEFVKRVYESGLKGFNFVKIWPLQKGENWRTLWKQKGGNNTTRDLKSETLVVMFSLAGKRPNGKEKKLIRRLENELDVLLAVETMDQSYFGSYEGSDIADNEFRIFLTTPDAIKLEKRIEPWLKRLNWPHPVRIAKRFGNLHDVNAIEKITQLEV